MSISSPLRVLIVDNSRGATGALNAMRRATGALRPGIDFELALPVGSTNRAALETDGYVVHELPFVELSRRKVDLLRYVPMLLHNGWRLRRLAARRNVAILHLNDYYNLTAYVARWLSGCRLPVFTHVRFLPQVQLPFLARSWRWLAEHAAQQVLCVSDSVRAYFASGHARVQMVYDTLPGCSERLPPYAVRPQAARAVQLLYLGNYIRGKGQNFVLEAYRLAQAHNPNMRLRFMGGDMEMAKNRAFRNELVATAHAVGLGNFVHFDGFTADPEATIKAHDIILNLSEAESFSLTCLDALYYGVPLIATDCGGPAELFEANVSGLLVPNRDVAAMAAAMVHLAENAGQRQAFAQASRVFVRQKFAPAHTYQGLAECYRGVIAGR